MPLAEIPYPLINPEIVRFGDFAIRWYGVSYILAFALAWIVLRDLSKRDRWPVPAERVGDVLFWGILGVFLGGRIGWVLFYGIPGGAVQSIGDVLTVWKGGMSFHGGLIGVILAYWIYTAKTGKPRGDFFDGLTLATPLGILCVRLANFVNAELYGRPWDGPWAMRFPRYEASEFGGTPNGWYQVYDANPDRAGLFTDLRHPSQLYEGLLEGIVLFLFLRWLMLRKGVGGGRIAASFLVGYGVLRFFVEFVRKPDSDLGFVLLGFLTRGQELCFAMILAGLVVFAFCAAKERKRSRARDAG